MIRHPFDPNTRPDFKLFRERLAEALGHPVEYLTNESELIIENAENGEWLDVDPELVAQVLADVERGTVKSSEAEAAEKFDKALTVNAKLNVFREYLGAKVEIEAQRRAQSIEDRRALRDRVAAQLAENPDVLIQG